MNYLGQKELQEKLHLSEKQAKALFFLPDFPSIKLGSKRLISEDKLTCCAS